MPKHASSRSRPLVSAPQIDEIFSIFAQIEPHPRTELVAPNPFCLLVAIVLSAQATDISVNKATGPLFKKYTTPQALIKLGEEGLKSYIKTIGLFNAKAKNVIGLCQILVQQYSGQIPRDRAALMQLPGVGRKTANVWLNCALGAPTIGVDTHVQRVANRLGLCRTATPERTEEALERVIPAEYKRHAHHWLILHGRYICKARRPECWRCPVARCCAHPTKNIAA